MIKVEFFNINEDDFNKYLYEETNRYISLINKLENDIVIRHNMINTYSISDEEYDKILEEANKVKETSDVVVVIGAGGSFLGTKAGISIFGEKIKFVFVGNNFDAEYVSEVIDYLKDKDFIINLVSKSGNTLETIIAFNIFKELLDEKYKKEANKRIYITSTAGSGLLYEMSQKNKNIFFDIPVSIGGRYSIITSVSLFPFAINNIDIKQIIKGFNDARNYYLYNNDCFKYAVMRNHVYSQGKNIDLFITYSEKLKYFADWYRQLFAESQGKDNIGLFPSTAIYSTDLHSVGQYVQEGQKSIIENILYVEQPNKDIPLKLSKTVENEFNFLQGKTLSQINKSCLYGTIRAHRDTPNILVSIPVLDEYTFGWLIYFYEEACIIGSILLGVNPFNQDGVEEYKKEMRNILNNKEGI